MSTTTVKRGPRRPGPEVPQGPVVLQAPPELPRDGRDAGWLVNLLPMLAGLGSVAFFFMPGANSVMMVMGAVTFVSSLVFAGITAVRQRNGGKGKLADARRDYLRYLGQVRAEVIATESAQRRAARWTHPDPRDLWSVVAGGERLWERRPSDPDFLAVRFGTGNQRLATELIPPDSAPLDELEPMCVDALRRFLTVRGTVADLPVAVALRSVARVLVTGDDDTAEAVSAVLAQLAAFHAPEDLQICVLAQGGRARRWEWLKWLPHVQHPTAVDAVGPQRMIYDDLGDAERDLAPLLAERPRFTPSVTLVDRPHLLLVLDTGSARSAAATQLIADDGLLGVTVLELTAQREQDADIKRHQLVVRPRMTDMSAPDHASDSQHTLDSATTSARPTATALRGSIEFADRRVFPLRADRLTLPQAEALARQLAPLRLSSGDADEPLLRALEFTDLLGITDAADIDPARMWGAAGRTSTNDRLRVPIGIGEDGQPVTLDLKEAALGGMGPHGLCVGATGSGKSELLRSLVAALALTHSSESVNFILADFKGGATFAGLAALPHVAAVITNLADDLSLVDRMRDALTGELNRRQELLRDNGNHKNIHDYEKARAAGADLVPLPSLVLIVDEFSELLTARPEFIEMFLQIGRIGRSLGVHLLLASKRLEEGRLRGLDTYLSYRLGLKTFSAGESRAVLGVPDAHLLPSVPGSGYLKYDTDSMTRFKAAYVSGPYGRAKALAVPAARSSAHRRALRFTALHQAPVLALHDRDADPDLTATTSLVAWDAAAEYRKSASTVLDVVVDRLTGQGPAAHRVWLPPLAESPTLDQLLPGVVITADRGLSATGWSGTGRLIVPIGLVDKPAEQRQDPQIVDLSGAGGHVLVVGGPRSGKSTTLRTLMFSLALTHTPEEIRFLGLDFGGGSLAALAGMPHVSGIAGRSNPDLVRRMVAETVGVLDRREAEGELRPAAFDESHVFLVIDGWAAFRGEYEALEQDVLDIARRGLGFGVHLLLSAGRWADVRAQLKDAVTTRVELRLGDPMESEMDRRTAAEVPLGVPGRGITKSRLHTLGALPEAAAEELVTAIDRAWDGPRAPRVRMLPSQVSYAELRETKRAATIPGQRTPGGIPIGVEEHQLSAVRLDFAAEPHFLVFGENESGKSNFLRLLTRGVVAAADAEELRAMLVLVDYRRSLMGAVPERYDAGYVVAGPAATGLIAELVPALRDRLPGPEVTQEQLRNRSWWTGKDVFVVVDDYDLVASATGNPLAPLVELLPYARDIGLHLILARQSGGAGRAMFDPVLQRLRELNTPGLLLSGDRDEGQLLGGARPSRQPPGRGQLVSRRLGTMLVQTAWAGDVVDQPEGEATGAALEE